MNTNVLSVNKTSNNRFRSLSLSRYNKTRKDNIMGREHDKERERREEKKENRNDILFDESLSSRR